MPTLLTPSLRCRLFSRLCAVIPSCPSPGIPCHRSVGLDESSRLLSVPYTAVGQSVPVSHQVGAGQDATPISPPVDATSDHRPRLPGCLQAISVVVGEIASFGRRIHDECQSSSPSLRGLRQPGRHYVLHHRAICNATSSIRGESEHRFPAILNNRCATHHNSQ